MKRATSLIFLALLSAHVLGVAPSSAARADDPSEPVGFTSHSYRLDVNFEDVQGTLFSASLNDIPSSVPTPAAQWIGYNLDTGTFDVDSSGAKCFILSGSPKAVPCSSIADMVDKSADGGVDETILAVPTRPRRRLLPGQEDHGLGRCDRQRRSASRRRRLVR
ncbi:MAG TPA: hypothetical protein VFM96_05690 [Gaiellaceae bacterium]|nr:hypothetical protein [Gaiellaceae bacterium]